LIEMWMRTVLLKPTTPRTPRASVAGMAAAVELAETDRPLARRYCPMAARVAAAGP
jgi:hypothetical protein